MKKVCILAALLVAASSAQAVLVPLTNGDFEATTQNAFASGFDDNAGYDTPGWQDLVETFADSGVENDAAWWGTFDGYSAFMQIGDGAFNLSGYTIQAGDEITVGFMGKSWDNASEWTATVFYDDPANVIGTYTTAVDGTWTAYANPTAITATAGSVGGTLGVSFQNTAGAGFANLDNVTLDVIPEPATFGLFGLAGAALLFVRSRFSI